MNHILKLQPPAKMFGSLVNTKYDRYICGHCLRKHAALIYTERGLSTYVSALKLLLKRKEGLKTSENGKIFSKNLLNKKRIYNRLTDLVNVTNFKSTQTRVEIQQIKASEVKAFAEEPGLTFARLSRNECSYDSTMSYEPSLMIPKDSLMEATQSFLIEHKVKGLKPKQKESIISSNKSSNISYKIEKYARFNVKPKVKVKGLKKVKEKDKIGNISTDILKILPLSTVEIFPMPKHLQENITKKSEEAIKMFTEPNVKPLSNVIETGRVNVFPEEKKLEELEEPSKELELNPETFEKFEEDLSTKEHVFIQSIHSYVDVCANSQMLKEAFKMISVSRKKLLWQNARNKTNLRDIYNTLLHSYSLKGDWEVVSIILQWMNLDGITYNCETYAAILDCLGRVNGNLFGSESGREEEVKKYIKDLYNNNNTLNDLFTRTTLTKDKHEKILETIRRVLPCFENQFTKINLNSNCNLLKDLYEDFNMLQAPLNSGFTSETMENFVEEQLLLEQNFSIKVKPVYRTVDSSPNYVKNVKKLEELKEKWKTELEKGFLQNLKTTMIQHSRFPNKFNLYVYLSCLPVETYVDAMMETVQNLLVYSGGYSPSTAQLYKTLGHNIYRRYQIKKKIDTGVMDRTEKLFKKYCSWYVDPTEPAKNSRQEWQMLIQDFQDGCPIDTKEIKWPALIRTSLGKNLYDVILKNVKISMGSSKNQGLIRDTPVFYLILRTKGLKSSEEIKCHPAVGKLLQKVGFENLHFEVDQIPMVCPPKPWKAVNHGGYLILPTDYVRRSQECVGKTLNLNKIPIQQLYSTFDSLNALQAVPWTVNKDVLDVVIEVFQNGGFDELDVPKYPDTDPVPMNITPEMSPRERWEEFQRKEKILQERKNQYGLWCEALYRISLANHFRNRVFWFPQNFDFRGRVYPVPPHLNHLGADLFRSLLTFAKGKPIGPKGLDWIKIHTINLTGTHKKRPVEERLEYANTIIPDILDSAENPLSGRKWWMKSEEPWQTLAACMEIKKILYSPDPEMYVSNFPIHQDGSCNGLQHYAALGRDTIGARSVNLSPSNEPQDVYSTVTQIIEEERLKDAAEGVEVAQVLEGFIKRKVVKQTIMTTVYGVTRYGARLQIAGQLEDISDFPKEYVWKAAGYLTAKTFLSLKQMFTSAKEIQDWFLQCAEIISKRKQYVQWMSPLGLPILQPYAKVLSMKQRQKNNCLKLPNTMKQKNAFAPNFVHSLDSSHMMLTALYSEQAGITFASIHDCYWTHPSSVDVMNRICREQFVSLHSQPVLDDLSEFFIKCYTNETKKEDEEMTRIFRSVPKTGEFDLETVLNSVYFFS